MGRGAHLIRDLRENVVGILETLNNWSGDCGSDDLNDKDLWGRLASQDGVEDVEEN